MRKFFNPRRSIISEVQGNKADDKTVKGKGADKNQTSQSSKDKDNVYMSCSVSNSTTVKTIKRSLLRNSKFQDMVYYVAKLTQMQKQERMTMKLKRDTSISQV